MIQVWIVKDFWKYFRTTVSKIQKTYSGTSVLACRVSTFQVISLHDFFVRTSSYIAQSWFKTLFMHFSCWLNSWHFYCSFPDYKGYVRIICTDACLVEYHTQCWKRLKSLNKYTDKLTDKVNQILSLQDDIRSSFRLIFHQAVCRKRILDLNPTKKPLRTLMWNNITDIKDNFYCVTGFSGLQLHYLQLFRTHFCNSSSRYKWT